MLKFDSTINSILENIIFEQNQIEEDPKTIFYKTIEDIKNRLNTDPEGFFSESELKYNSDDSGFLSKLESLIKPYSKELNEQVDWKGAWEKAKDLGGKAAEAIGPVLQDVGEFAAEKVGEIGTALAVKEYMDHVENKVSESFWYKLAAVFEPTGVMSWPYYSNALKLYEQHKGTDEENIYFLNLLAAQISIIPGVRLPIGILTAPFKIVTNPIKNIFGNRAKQIAKQMADGTASRVAKGKAATKATNKLEKTGVGTKLTDKIKATTKAATEKVKDVAKGTAKKAAKGTAAAAKTATVISSGDIPTTWKKWTEDGKKTLEKMEPREGTLGKFPRFNEISTQGF